MPLTVPTHPLVKALEDHGIKMVGEGSHEGRCFHGVATCEAIYKTQFFLFMTSPVAVKTYNTKFQADVPKYTEGELETAWTRTKEIFDSAKGLRSCQSWEDIANKVPHLSDKSISAMILDEHPIKGIFRNMKHVKIAIIAHLQPGCGRARMIKSVLGPDRFLTEQSLDVYHDEDRDKAVKYLSGDNFNDIAGMRLAGLAKFRKLVLNGTWNINDDTMFGRPELALFLYKALDTSGPQCLMDKEQLTEIQDVIKQVIPLMPENMKEDLKVDLFDKFEVSL